MKKIPYHLNPKYKERVSVELDNMLAAGIIEPVEESALKLNSGLGKETEGRNKDMRRSQEIE